MLEKEPHHALGHDNPGTIKQLFEDEKQGKYLVTILCNPPAGLSNPIEVKKKYADMIMHNWEQNKRVALNKISEKDGSYHAGRGYKIVPNIELWTDPPHLDITI